MLLGIRHLFTCSSDSVMSEINLGLIVSFTCKFYPMIIFLNQCYFFIYTKWEQALTSTVQELLRKIIEVSHL